MAASGVQAKTVTTNASVTRNADQMMLDNGQAMVSRGKALSQDDVVRLEQQMMDKATVMREAGQPTMRNAETMMTQGQQMMSGGQGMMGR